MESCIVAIAKNEELYLKDWIDYHKNLGFNHIFIIDNNDENINTQFEICKNLNVKIFDMRGRETVRNYGNQQGVYAAIYDFIKDNFPDIKWICYIDIDEYLNLDGKFINEFLEQEKFNDVDLIHFNWKCYGDNNYVYYEPRPVIERFTEPLPFDAMYENIYIPDNIYLNMHVKSILKVSNKIPFFSSVHTVEFKEEDHAKCVDVNGDISDYRLSWQPICYRGGHIKHFITKSTEEFCKRRLMDNPRIDGDLKRDKNIEINNYFSVNVKTYSKIKLIEQYLK